MTQFYRDRVTGQVLTERQVKAANKRVLSWAPGAFSPSLCDKLGVDPVTPTEPPAVDQNFFIVDGRHAHLQRPGAAVQTWVVTPRYETLEQRRVVAAQVLDRIFMMKRDGGIRHEGLPVKTTPGGLAYLRAALDVGAGVSYVTSEGRRELSRADLQLMYSAASAHVQACFAAYSRKLDEAAVSENPELIDFHGGWPGE